VSPSVASVAHCINPDCARPYPQPWDSKFCNSCGTSLRLNNRYIPINKLGSGGFAVLYTVWDLQTQTERVLKVLMETAPKALELFEQEASVLMSLRHSGVPRVEADGFFYFHLGSSAERRLPCIVMEKINGPTLQDILEQHPQGCSEESILNWLHQSLDILDELHRRQIIHRDLKPSNLMLRQQTGQLVAIDFGGAKQIGLIRRGQEVSSTRLVSPGYSPPEQIAGGGVGPATDFYALGRTMIHLLTGEYPADLEDPVTGELRWRNRVRVSPYLADVLDEMVQSDVQKRPATASQIQARLTGVSRMQTTPSWAAAKVPESFYQVVSRGAGAGLQVSWWVLTTLSAGIATFSKALAQVTFFWLRVITQLLKALLDTLWEMLVGGMGAIIGVIAGFGFAYWTPLGSHIASFLAQQLPVIFPGISISIGAQILLFAFAGLGTAVGLTEAGGFGQHKRPLITGLMGILGYTLGYVIWQATAPSEAVPHLVALITVAVVPLTLGLGLPSHYLVHSFVAAVGTSIVFSSLASLNLLPIATLVALLSETTSLPSLGISVAFFTLLGITLAAWLGVSYYVVVPFLRWLGWR
jgi:hypothetical protein